MVDLDVIVCKFQHLTGHPLADLLRVSPVLEVHMIGEHLNLMGTSRQEGAPVSQRFDDGQQLKVINVVVALCRCKGGGIEPYRVFLIVVSLLHEDRPYDES